MSPPQDQGRLSRSALEAFFSTDRAGAKELTEALLQEFGSLNDALAASPGRVTKAIGEAPARRLREFRALAEAVFSERVTTRPWISLDEMACFLNFEIGYSPVELFYAFYFDAAGCVIRSGVVARGTATSAQVNARDLIARAVELGSCSLLIAHNHPSGTPRPSQRDLEFTARIERMAKDFELRLIDHLVVARGTVWSIRRNVLIGGSDGATRANVFAYPRAAAC